MLNTDISTNCASNFIQNDRIFKLLLGIRVPKTKDFVENREDRWMDGWMDGWISIFTQDGLVSSHSH